MRNDTSSIEEEVATGAQARTTYVGASWTAWPLPHGLSGPKSESQVPETELEPQNRSCLKAAEARLRVRANYVPQIM